MVFSGQKIVSCICMAYLRKSNQHMEFDEPKMKLLPHKLGRKIFAIAFDFNFQLGLKIKLFHNTLQQNTDNKQRAKIWNFTQQKISMHTSLKKLADKFCEKVHQHSKIEIYTNLENSQLEYYFSLTDYFFFRL